MLNVVTKKCELDLEDEGEGHSFSGAVIVEVAFPPISTIICKTVFELSI